MGAEQAFQAAVSEADARAADAQREAQARIADAENRALAVEEHARKVEEDASAREAARIVDAQQRVAALEEEAQRRAQKVQEAAAEQLEIQLQYVRECLVRVPKDWAVTENRIESELERGQRRQDRERMATGLASERLERCKRRADDVKLVADAASAELQRVQELRVAGDVQRIVDDANAFQGLEELVQSLRSGTLWQDLQVG